MDLYLVSISYFFVSVTVFMSLHGIFHVFKRKVLSIASERFENELVFDSKLELSSAFVHLIFNTVIAFLIAKGILFEMPMTFSIGIIGWITLPIWMHNTLYMITYTRNKNN